MNFIEIYHNKITKEFEIIIDKLREYKVNIEYKLCSSSELYGFDNYKVKRLLQTYGEVVLPILLVNGEIVSVEKDIFIDDIFKYLQPPKDLYDIFNIEIKEKKCEYCSKMDTQNSKCCKMYNCNSKSEDISNRCIKCQKCKCGGSEKRV